MNMMPDAGNDLIFKKTIHRWDEAIPLGNGISGALIWGPSEKLRFSLDRADVWDCRIHPGNLAPELTYENLVRLSKEKNIPEIIRVFHSMNTPTYPSKLPSGRIVFDFGVGKNVCSRLELDKAQAQLQIGEDIRLESFLHAQQRVGMIRINRPADSFSLVLENPEFGEEGNPLPEEQMQDAHTDAGILSDLKRLLYPLPVVVSEPDRRSFVQQVKDGITYGVFLRLRQTDGMTEIAYIVATSNDGPQWQQNAEKLVEQALEQGYDAMFRSHAAWWTEYWGQSGVSLPERLFEKNWYLTTYLLGAGSREGGWPMALQGVWTADEGALPPWKGDYHFDLNVQMTYSSYQKANHLPEGKVLMDYMCAQAEVGRNFAKNFYHSEGIVYPSTAGIDGCNIGGWAMYCYSPTNHLWTCFLFGRHYTYTGDRKYLEEVAYPYIAESAQSILGILEERDGKYYLPFSSSPEIHGCEAEAFLEPNSNYDLTLLRWTFGALAEYAAILGNGEQDRWQAVLEKLPQLAVSEKGILMISPSEMLPETHRHHSHAMAIHPIRLLPYESEENKRIIDATIGYMEELGTGYWTGYSFGWMANLYAVQRNGNGAARQLEIFWNDFCSPNGFHLNGDFRNAGTSSFHYRPFTLEGNFAAADAVQEMLLLSENGLVELFPAIPDRWLEEEVEFTTFRGEGGILVSARLEQGIVTQLQISAPRDMEVALRVNEKSASIVQKLGLTAKGDRAILKITADAPVVCKL